jgi:hypothetical protein
VHRGRHGRGGRHLQHQRGLQPGTQCFNYANTGCDVKVCLRFCNGNADCAAFGAGGGGPGSVCEGPVMCPDFLTAYHTCTFNCDPRAMAAAAGGGCPNGLACVMPGRWIRWTAAAPNDAHQARRPGVHVGGRLRARLDLQPDERHQDLPPDLPLRRERLGACTATTPTTARPPAPPAARSRTTRFTASASERRQRRARATACW